MVIAIRKGDRVTRLACFEAKMGLIGVGRALEHWRRGI